MMSNAECIMFYTDIDVKGYACINGLTAFNLGGTGIHCLVLPIPYLNSLHQPFDGWSDEKIHATMAINLAAYLARHHVAAG